MESKRNLSSLSLQDIQIIDRYSRKNLQNSHAESPVVSFQYVNERKTDWAKISKEK